MRKLKSVVGSDESLQVALDIINERIEADQIKPDDVLSFKTSKFEYPPSSRIIGPGVMIAELVYWSDR